jgi:hypothetical protein
MGAIVDGLSSQASVHPLADSAEDFPMSGRLINVFVARNELHLKEDSSGSSNMVDSTPQSTFRGLPLSPEQDAEVRHYIKRKSRRGAPWDTPELQAILHDMLEPPGDDDAAGSATVNETRSATERAGASVDETMEPVQASEERYAAMEAEGMKRPRN